MVRMGSILAVLVVLAASAPAQQKAAKTAKKRVAAKAPAVVFDPAAANSPAFTGIIVKNTAGSHVLRAQVLLDRANFSVGEIDGKHGLNMSKAVAAFQQARGIASSGDVDEVTWTELNADTAPAVTAYTTTAEDVAGPFERIPADMMEKAKLKRLGYQSPLEAIAEKFHASPKLLMALNPGVRFSAAGTELLTPNVTAPASPLRAAAVVVDKSDRSVTAINAEGKVLAHFPATIGSSHDPLPIGKWKIVSVHKNPVFNYNPELFWDADPTHAKARLPAGPNNPVGAAWLTLSKEHYGIHGTPEPSNISRGASHGCIRLTNWDILRLAEMVAPGTPAVLQE